MSLNLEALKERNQSNTAQALKPYQPLEYAVPQELGSDIAAAPRKRDASAGYSYVGDVDANGGHPEGILPAESGDNRGRLAGITSNLALLGNSFSKLTGQPEEQQITEKRQRCRGYDRGMER